MLLSGLPEQVSGDEELARFVKESNKRNTLGAKPGAFMPPQNARTSVARHGSTPLADLTELAALYLPGCHVYGAAILSAATVRRNGLDAIPDEPPIRHANIVGWPADADAEMEKAARLAKAQACASASSWVEF